MTTLSRAPHRDAEAPVQTAAHVAGPAPTGGAVPAVPRTGPAAPAGGVRVPAARFSRLTKTALTAPPTAPRRAVPLTWNLTQATDWDPAQATDWDLTQATGRNLRQAELTPS
jgi:hypothetical protein